MDGSDGENPTVQNLNLDPFVREFLISPAATRTQNLPEPSRLRSQQQELGIYSQKPNNKNKESIKL